MTTATTPSAARALSRGANDASIAALARIGLTYWWRHGRLPDLANPTRFTEWVQWRKLFDRNPRMPALTDKVAVKHHVARVLGPEWLVTTLWHGDILPEICPWLTPIVVKSRHGCNHTRFVRSHDEDWLAVRTQAERWLRHPYGYWLDEWLYRDIPRGIIVEPFIGERGVLPVDYKLYVFGGRVSHVQVHLEREHAHRWILFTRDWKRRSARDGESDPLPPMSLDAMIAAAERLAASFDFVRADFYEVAGQPRFGELSFYPGSGLDPFNPDEIDLEMGALWTVARVASPHELRTHRPALAF